MIEELRSNIEGEIQILRELHKFFERSETETGSEKKVYLEMVSSLEKRIKLLNSALPEIINKISLNKKLTPENDAGIKIGETKSEERESKPEVTLKGRDKEKYLKELHINDKLLKKIIKKKNKENKKEKISEKANKFNKYSNKYFFETSDSLIKKGNFKNLLAELRQSNLGILGTTYISTLLMSLVISFFAGLIFTVFVLFFDIGLTFPFVSFYNGNYMLRFIKVFWIIFMVPLIVGGMFFFYPGAEKKTLGGRINQELPFAVIHMSSISGSGIQPLEIFRIIGRSKEYKYLGPEIRKIINQTTIYGYDLTNALKNIAHATPSKPLSELLTGISVTIHSGGDIETFFKKRGESLLLEYRLLREQYTKSTETFMDLYISIVIAAPMILLMLLIMISVAQIGLGIGINQLSLAIVALVAIINIIFLAFLHIKQPGY